MLQTTVIQGVGDPQIDAFCLGNAFSLIYASSHFMRLISQETASTPYWIVVRDGSRICAALPVLVKYGRFGPVVNSLAYYGSNGGVITQSDDPGAKLTALHSYIGFCDTVHSVSSTLITNPLLADQAFYEANLPHDLRDERIGQFTFFPADRSPASLMGTFSDPRPRNIRKAQREGIEVQVLQTEEAIDFLYVTHRDNITSIGGLPKRREFFQAIPDNLPTGGWKVYVACRGAERVAALLLLYFNQTVEYFTPCVVEAHRSSQALPLLVYQAMVDAMQQGFAQWNWGGTWLTQDGVYAFKKKWGTTDLRYYYYTSLRNPAIRRSTREELLREYPGFYVLPFSALEASSPIQEAI